MERFIKNIYSSYRLAIAKVVGYRLVTVPVFLVLVLSFQMFRFYLLPFMGLMPQDAYYHLYGQNLDWSYFDHPGMIAYLTRTFSEILGHSVYTLKFMDFLVTSISLLAFYQLCGQFLSKTKTTVAMVLMASSLLITMISLNTTPDVPLFLFWILALISLHKAIFQGKKGYWPVSGVFMGLALLSKYTAVFLPIGLLIFLIVSRTHRNYLKTPYPYLALLLAALFTLPIFYWNYEHDFASFGFQTGERTQKIFQFDFSLGRLFGFLGSQALIVLPFTFFALLTITLRFLKRLQKGYGTVSPKLLFLASFFLPLFLTFALISPFYWVKFNWLVPAYVCGILLVAGQINRKKIAMQTTLAILLHIVLALEIIFYPVAVKSDDTWFGWQEVSEKVKSIHTEYPDDFIFSGDTYKTASVLNFYLDKKIYSCNIIGEKGLHYSILDKNLQSLKCQNAIFIDSESRFKSLSKSDRETHRLRQFFEHAEQLDPIIVRNNFNVPVRKFLVYRCYAYSPPK